jgi:hypothetical protein
MLVQAVPATTAEAEAVIRTPSRDDVLESIMLKYIVITISNLISLG